MISWLMNMEEFVEWELAQEPEVLPENLHQCRFVHLKFHMTLLASNPGRRSGKPATKRLSYGTARHGTARHGNCMQLAEC
jgi:hypothetical protein